MRLRFAAAWALSVLLIVGPFNVAPVEAHCPGGNPVRSYAYGGRSIQSASYWANGVEAWIGYTNPNTCTNNQGNAFSTEFVNISRNGANDGWVQVGWTKREAYSAPRVKCEFKGTSSTGFGTYTTGRRRFPQPLMSSSSFTAAGLANGAARWTVSSNSTLIPRVS